MTRIEVRPAEPADAAAMSKVLMPILRRWRSARRGDPDHVLAHYIAHPDRLICSVAGAGGQVLGFQSLKRATPGNPYDLPDGWGIIGTYVAEEAAGRGVGRALFAQSRTVAEAAGLDRIDATIGITNEAGRAYYAAMGFAPYRDLERAIGMAYRVRR